MKKLINKIKAKTLKTALKVHNAMSKKDKGEATLIVVIALIVIAVLLLVIFREQIFGRLQTAISNTGNNIDSVFSAS